MRREARLYSEVVTTAGIGSDLLLRSDIREMGRILGDVLKVRAVKV